MEIIKIGRKNAEKIVPLIADFRVALSSYRGIEAKPDIESAREEIAEFLERGFPVFAAEENGEAAGYLVCRLDGPCVWVEHIFVKEELRRRGAASMLFAEAEKVAESFGGDTLFNFVHPNNYGMIAFLRSRGYTVLNMIEIRKPFEGEKPAATVRVGDTVFDY